MHLSKGSDTWDEDRDLPELDNELQVRCAAQLMVDERQGVTLTGVTVHGPSREHRWDSVVPGITQCRRCSAGAVRISLVFSFHWFRLVLIFQAH